MAVQQSKTFLSVRGVSKSYLGVKALQAIDLEIREGEILALVGENGAGKSTLMKVLAGAVVPDEGTIELDGEEIAFRSPSDAHDRGISTIYQELMLVGDLSVVENVYLGHLKRKSWGVVDWSGMRRDATRILTDLGFKGRLDEPVRNLSVAERQLVEIAKAITRHCRLLIMDEPTAPLNREEVRHFFSVVESLRSTGLSIIFITHHLNEIFEICERAVVLREGRRVGEAEIEDLTEERLVEMMLGRKIDTERELATSNVALGPVVVSVKGLTTGSLLQDVTFDVRKGEVLGLAGLMGSGRSEILRALYGVDKPKAGNIEIAGKAAMFSGPGAALAGGVGLGPEDRKTDGLVLSMPIRHNATMASMRRYAGPFKMRTADEVERVKKLCSQLQVKYSSTELPVGKLSGGNQQKIILARLLDAEVDVFLLDEPTRGIDIGAKEAIFELVRDLAAKGAAVIFVSSVIEEVLRVSDKVLCLNLGRVTGRHDRGEFSMSQIMLNVMGGHPSHSQASVP